jgi:hypothetical protein
LGKLGGKVILGSAASTAALNNLLKTSRSLIVIVFQCTIKVQANSSGTVIAD